MYAEHKQEMPKMPMYVNSGGDQTAEFEDEREKRNGSTQLTFTASSLTAPTDPVISILA